MAMSTRTRGVALGSVAAVAIALGAAFVWLERSPEVGTVEVVQPTAAEMELVEHARVFFGHQSVGSNIISGLPAVFAAAERDAPPVVETRGPVPAGDGAFAHAHVGVNGDPLGKLADFASILDGPAGDHVDVALLKLCYVDIVASTDVRAVFDAYRETMGSLEQRHPGVHFIYTTVPLSTDRGWKATVKSWIGMDDQLGPADNLARQQYNSLVREEYGDSGRLFDIAAVEATMGQTPMQRTLDGSGYYVLNPALSADPGHLNELGSRAAAAELIRVVARVASA